MRGLHLAVLLLLAGLSGCLGGPGAPAGQDQGRLAAPAPAPVLEAGQSFHYETSGAWDLVPSFTLVVANATPDGYLLAGEHPADLIGEPHLERAWFGHRDEELNRPATRMHPEGWQLFDFPLEDGKTWYRGGTEVVAHASSVPVPGGREPGYVIEAGHEGEETHLVYTYAPSIGYLTRYTYTWHGRVIFDLALTSTGTTEAWTWYDVGEVHELDGRGDLDGLETAIFELPDGYDEVVVYAGGSERTTAAVTLPSASASPWTYTVDGKALAFTGELLPGAAGPWTATLERPSGGESYLALVAVDWLGPGAR